MAVLVSETIYEDIDTDIKRYASDIQSVLPNTKTLIIPTPDDAQTYEVASLLEWLYYEWHKNLDSDIDYESALVGAVFVWDIPIPVVYQEDRFSKTLLPYVDFADKLYTYSHTQEKYLKSDTNQNNISAEIWHGVIAPNPASIDHNGNTLSDQQHYNLKIQALRQYFDKNHDFYLGQGLFQSDHGILTGKKGDTVSDEYEPYMFYYDQFIEKKSINKQNYLAYRAWLENREDIAYNRFSAKLFHRINTMISGAQDAELSQLLENVLPDLVWSDTLSQTTPVLSSDIQSMKAILNIVKKYIETLSSPTIAYMTQAALHSWRYAPSPDQPNIDTLPKLVTLMDEAAVEIIHSANNDLEQYINTQILSQWSTPKAVPVTYERVVGVYQKDETENTPIIRNCNSQIYTHFSYWRKGSDIQNTANCSLYRGSYWPWLPSWRWTSVDGYSFDGTIVEANRWRNVQLTHQDLELCQESLSVQNGRINGWVSWYWWWNTPINLAISKDNSTPTLWTHDINRARVPIFDILGAQTIDPNNVDTRSTTSTSQGNPTLASCWSPNYILTSTQDVAVVSDGPRHECSNITSLQSNTFSINQDALSCDTQNNILDLDITLDDILAWDFDPGVCGRVIARWYLDDTLYYDSGVASGSCNQIGDRVTTHIFTYKEIPSLLTHTSPTPDEIYTQLKTPFSAHLPIDADRYAEFWVDQFRDEVRIFYPNFFRVIDQHTGTMNRSEISNGSLKPYLDTISTSISDTLQDRGIDASIDLFSIISHEWVLDTLTPHTSLGETKQVSFYDTLLNAIQWYQLDTLSNKYRYIFENYLNDQFDGLVFDGNALSSEMSEYIVPSNKKLYELVYLNVPGDGQNMFVNMSPDDLQDNPYGSEIQAIQELKTTLISKNIAESSPWWIQSSSCSPPEWVPLWDFIPLIWCELDATAPDKLALINESIQDKLTQHTTQTWSYEVENIVFRSRNIANEVSGIETHTQSYVTASDQWNIFLFDESIQDISSIVTGVNNHSSASQKLLIWAGWYVSNEYQDLEYPIEVTIHRWNQLISNNTYQKNDLRFYAAIGTISDSWIYTISLTDAQNWSGTYVFEVMPQLPHDITLELGSHIVETHGVQIPGYISLHDVFGNISLGDGYTATLELDGWSLLFQDTPDPHYMSTHLLQGYVNFVLESRVNPWTTDIHVEVMNASGEKVLEVSDSIQVVTDLSNQDNTVTISESSRMYVGWNIYELRAQIRDVQWNIITDYNGFATTTLQDIYGRIGSYIIWENDTNSLSYNNQIQFIDGVATFVLQTWNSAGDDIDIHITLPWIKTPQIAYIDIAPEQPVQLDMTLSKPYIATTQYDFSTVTVTLKDQFGNIVQDDNTTHFELEIPEQYSDSIRSDALSKRASSWSAQFKIYANRANQDAYFKVSAIGNTLRDDIVLSWQTSIQKSLVNTIPGMRTWNPKVLSSLGKKFFHELNPDEYISVFSDRNTLTNSPDFINLSSRTQDALLKLWDTHNSHTISAVPYAIWKITTPYTWSHNTHTQDNTALSRRYNGLYSVLLGAPYGDHSISNYLGWNLLFDENNRSLAVTSILNYPYQQDDVFVIQNTWNIISTTSGSDLFQDIQLHSFINDDNRLEINIHNRATDIFIGSLIYNIDTLRWISCASEIQNIHDCITSDETSFVIQPTHSQAASFTTHESVVLRWSTGEKLLEVHQDGTMQPYGDLVLKVNNTIKSDYLVLDAIVWWKKQAQVLFSLPASQINTSKNKKLFEQKQKTLSNTLLLYLQSNRYSHTQVQDDDTIQMVVSYQDILPSNPVLDIFHIESTHGFENFREWQNIGWEWDNTSLLSWSAWKSVWEATQDFMSFSTINLWDPVIALWENIISTWWSLSQDTSPIEIPRWFDSSVGTILSKTPDLISYQVFDYNNDQSPDILLIKSSGYLGVLENMWSWNRFRDRWNIAHIADIWEPKHVKTWDFSGDGYDDIFFVNDNGKPVLLNNHLTIFHRQTMILDAWDIWEHDIILSHVFDMDNDTLSDIVSLNSLWEIYVYYGQKVVWSSSEVSSIIYPQFQAYQVGNSASFRLDSTPRRDGWLIYFDSLYQPDTRRLNTYDTTSEEILATLTKNAQNISASSGLDTPSNLWESFDVTDAAESLIDTTLFQEISYNPDITNNTTSVDDKIEQAQDIISQSVSENFPWSTQRINDTLVHISESYGENFSYSAQSIDTQQTHFIRSEYAQHVWVDIIKRLKRTSSGSLSSGSSIRVELELTNNTNTTLQNIAYLEDIDPLFTLDSESIQVADNSVSIIPEFQWYGFMWHGFDMSPWETLRIQYDIQLAPITFGHIEVGYFESDTIGDDLYSDIILKSSYQNCWNDAILYASSWPRSYTSQVSSSTCDTDTNQIPDFLSQNRQDDDGNGIPDYIDNTRDQLIATGTDIFDENSDNEILKNLYIDSDRDGVPDSDDFSDYYDSARSGIQDFNDHIDDLSDDVDHIAAGLCRGFGWWASWALPLNWAPLAPWSDPVLYWYPIGDGLRTGEWYPVFSTLTWLPAVCGTTPCCLPSVHPTSPLAYVPGPTCGAPSAGGYLWVWAPTNTYRLFVTPTLTWAAGVAFCFGGPAFVASNANPLWIHPLVPGGNCVVAATPLASSTDNAHITPDPRSMSTHWWRVSRSDDFDVIYGNCTQRDDAIIWSSPQDYLDSEYIESYIDFRQRSSTHAILPPTLQRDTRDILRNYGREHIWDSQWFTGFNEPILNVWIEWSDGGFIDLALSSDISRLEDDRIHDVIQIKNKRVAAFPNFLMDWVTRQIEEIVVKLTDFPTLYVILPSFDHLLNDDWSDFSASVDKIFTPNSKNTSSSLSSLKNFTSWNQISGVKEAYTFLSQVPFINIEEEVVNIDIPWPSEDIDGAIAQWKLTLQQWEDEIQRVSGTRTGSGNFLVEANRFTRTLDKNIQILESYKNIPQDISQLLLIKQVWIEQIIGAVEDISDIMGGWIYRNGERFKNWVETFLLIKTILTSWQLIIDIFNDYNAQCHDCKNERYDLQYFIWKLISVVIPDIPVIVFPKWPDFVLDLHNVRVGIDIVLPDFNFNQRPIIIPQLPPLDLSGGFWANIHIPSIPILPDFQIPELPLLPDIPNIQLPNIPPAPQLPKILSSFEGILNILKLVVKMMCILKKSPFVPEWRAGDQIAFITERNGYSPIDFIDIELPQFSFPFVDAIRSTSYVNLEYDTEFIIEASRSMVVLCVYLVMILSINFVSMIDLSIFLTLLFQIRSIFE